MIYDFYSTPLANVHRFKFRRFFLSVQSIVAEPEPVGAGRSRYFLVGAGVKVRVPAPAPCYGSTLDKTEEILNDILVVNKYTIKVDSRLGYIPLILYYNKQRNTKRDYMHTLYKEDPRNRFARWRIL